MCFYQLLRDVCTIIMFFFEVLWELFMIGLRYLFQKKKPMTPQPTDSKPSKSQPSKSQPSKPQRRIAKLSSGQLTLSLDKSGYETDRDTPDESKDQVKRPPARFASGPFSGPLKRPSGERRYQGKKDNPDKSSDLVKGPSDEPSDGTSSSDDSGSHGKEGNPDRSNDQVADGKPCCWGCGCQNRKKICIGDVVCKHMLEYSLCPKGCRHLEVPETEKKTPLYPLRIKLSCNPIHLGEAMDQHDRSKSTYQYRRSFQFELPNKSKVLVGTAPMRIDTYIFNKTKWENQPRPTSLPPSAAWPPKQISDIISHFPTDRNGVAREILASPTFTNEEKKKTAELYVTTTGDMCLGEKVSLVHLEVCRNLACLHSLEEWEYEAPIRSWEDSFELRESNFNTNTAGGDQKDVVQAGVFTKKDFEFGELIGWVTGELRPYVHDIDRNNPMRIPIGPVTSVFHPTDSFAIIETTQMGNWTRFLTVTEDPLYGWAKVYIYRVGQVRILAVVASHDAPAGTEVFLSP